MTKICDFCYPIHDLAKNLIPYLMTAADWHSCLKYKELLMDFFDSLIANDEKISVTGKFALSYLELGILKLQSKHMQFLM